MINSDGESQIRPQPGTATMKVGNPPAHHMSKRFGYGTRLRQVTSPYEILTYLLTCSSFRFKQDKNSNIKKQQWITHNGTCIQNNRIIVWPHFHTPWQSLPLLSRNMSFRTDLHLTLHHMMHASSQMCATEHDLRLVTDNANDSISEQNNMGTRLPLATSIWYSRNATEVKIIVNVFSPCITELQAVVCCWRPNIMRHLWLSLSLT